VFYQFFKHVAEEKAKGESGVHMIEDFNEWMQPDWVGNRIGFQILVLLIKTRVDSM